ncbi:MAG: PIN domain-containing protein [Caldimonas sp.]
MPAALVDAGPLVALFGINQPRASHYRKLLQQAASELWSLATTWPCVTEASQLLDVPERYTLLRWIAASGITVFPFAQDDLEGMVALMRRYTESPRTEMDLADASLVWLAGDSGVTRVMTMDVRDFSRYRLPDGRHFELL